MTEDKLRALNNAVYKYLIEKLIRHWMALHAMTEEEARRHVLAMIGLEPKKEER